MRHTVRNLLKPGPGRTNRFIYPFQVADRFHLLCNASDALKELFDRKHREPRKAFEAANSVEVPAPWGADVYAAIRSAISTARLNGRTAFQAITATIKGQSVMPAA